MKAAYAERLSARIWFRHGNYPCRIWFSAEVSPYLAIERANAKGRDQFLDFLKVMKPRMPEGSRAHLGALLVDDRHRYVLVGKSMTPDVLQGLARFVRAHVEETPALAGLADAGVVQLDVDVRDDAAVTAIDLGKVEVYRDASLWEGLLPANAATLASTLARSEPGDRLWFWLDDSVPAGVPPLLVQRVADDPNRDRIDRLIEAVSPDGLDLAVTGFGVVTDDGTLQLVGTGLGASHLRAVAAWVKASVAAHPQLGRLKGLSFARLGAGGRVAEVRRDPSLWDGVPDVVVPGTIGATAVALDGLGEGEVAWFWLTGAGHGAPFLLVERVAELQDDELQAHAQRLFKRFPGSSRDALVGSVTRLPSGALLFATNHKRVKAFKDRVDAFVAAHQGRYPSLARLADAKLAAMDKGAAAAVLS